MISNSGSSTSSVPFNTNADDQFSSDLTSIIGHARTKFSALIGSAGGNAVSDDGTKIYPTEFQLLAGAQPAMVCVKNDGEIWFCCDVVANQAGLPAVRAQLDEVVTKINGCLSRHWDVVEDRSGEPYRSRLKATHREWGIEIDVSITSRVNDTFDAGLLVRAIQPQHSTDTSPPLIQVIGHDLYIEGAKLTLPFQLPQLERVLGRSELTKFGNYVWSNKGVGACVHHGKGMIMDLRIVLSKKSSQFDFLSLSVPFSGAVWVHSSCIRPGTTAGDIQGGSMRKMNGKGLLKATFGSLRCFASLNNEDLITDVSISRVTFLERFGW